MFLLFFLLSAQAFSEEAEILPTDDPSIPFTTAMSVNVGSNPIKVPNVL